MFAIARRVCVGAACLALLLAPANCSPEGDDASAASTSAFTVESGDRFVVSATSDQIVLHKEVDGTAFPFDDQALLGKAILIHPVAHRADEGVYARANAVHDGGDRWIVDASPLTLSEMESISEDDVVRIYIDPDRSSSPTLAPSSLHPRSFDGFAFDGFNLSNGFSLQTPSFARAGVTFSLQLQELSLAPQAVVEWSQDEGLELGFKGALDWKASLVLSGNVAGELFRSQTITSPHVTLFVPIGPVPVPVVLEAAGFVSCSATLSGPVDVTLALEAHASLGGSMKVKPSTGDSPANWVSQGRWAPEASGSASATPTYQGVLGGGFACSIPRIEARAYVAGVAGPYLAVTPTTAVDQDGVHVEGHVSAGAGAALLGTGVGVEVNLYAWKID